MTTTGSVDDATAVMEGLAWKLGVIMLVLGFMHMINIFVLSKWRKRFQHHNLGGSVPPPPPQPPAPRFAPQQPRLATPPQ
jgi:hypothetical protein